ncbi:MAG: hypothetical protein CME68_11795 [Halobacteriovoraceae bacterium]|nr:hypothetical protein [Halobacteriovoraceae bacterium]
MNLKISGLFWKKLLISFCFMKVLLFLEEQNLFANTTALIPSNFGLNRAETMTAYPYKGSYFWYNPALFKYSGLKINFVGLDVILDDNIKNNINDRLNQKKIDTLDEFSKILGQNDATISGGSLNVLKVYFPYFGLTTFAQGIVKSAPSSDGKKLNSLIRAGATSGFAISLGKLSIGYSAFLIKQAQVLSTPNSSQLATIKSHYEAGTLTPGNVSLGDYTNVYYGESFGQNVGLHYQFFNDNHSGIGVSILNARGSSFGNTKSLIKGIVKDLDKEMEKEAQEVGVTLQKPDSLKQMINAGIHLELGQKGDDFLNLSLSADYHDINGTTIDNKLSFASEFGLHIPDSVAVKFSAPIYKKDGTYYHVGLLNLNLIAGYRPKESYSYGATLGTHWGVNRALSLLRIDFQASKTVSLNKKVIPNSWGFQTNLSLIFLF